MILHGATGEGLFEDAMLEQGREKVREPKGR